MRAVQPVPDEFLCCYSLALGDLGFVMREDVVDATAMDIDLLTEQCSRHRAAFDVPSRPARAPRGIPFYIAIVFVPRLPQREVADVFLVIFIVLHAAGRLQLGEIKMRMLSVVREFIDAKINRVVFGLFSVAVLGM